MSKKYRRPLPVKTNIDQASTNTLKVINSPISGAKVKSLTNNAPAAKTSGYNAEKYIARDLKMSALVALFVVVIMVVIYFTLR
jgi:hypothetical protein